jgi:hypothetical protein
MSKIFPGIPLSALPKLFLLVKLSAIDLTSSLFFSLSYIYGPAALKFI